VKVCARPFTKLADELGEPRAGNIVSLGALVELTGLLEEETVASTLERLVRSERWLELDRRALVRGREAVISGGTHGN
jgi:Pyruvate/2-oxoacid:ferredoxin oxidoreductase gamma subunit